MNQFSYHLVGFRWDQNQVQNATCFFVRMNERLFLVTTYHGVTGWNGLQKVLDANYHDELDIILTAKATGMPAPVTLDLKPLKANLKKIDVSSTPDLAILEVDPALPDTYNIHSIEAHIGRNAITNETMQIHGYRSVYPAGSNLRSVVEDITLSAEVEFISYMGINYEVQTFNGTATPGFSGAPVFAWSDELGIVQFNGMCIAGEPGNKMQPKLLILQPQSIIAELEKTAKHSVITNLKESVVRDQLKAI